MRNALVAATAASVLLLSTPVFAGNMHEHHQQEPAQLSGKAAKSPSVKAYDSAAARMHKRMMITYTGNADIDFARGMVPHHQGAVDMVRVLNKYGKDAELRELGKRITLWQNTEIGLMQQWLHTHDNPKLKAEDNEAARDYKAAMASMHKNMGITYTGNADVDFVRGMIPHHQGAIDMANVLLKHGRDPQLLDIARDVVRSQQQEIAFMQEWLSKKGKK